MDTIENSEPVGVEGATSSQDTSSNDTQPAESAESVSDSNVEEAGKAPELLAGKYKSPQELEKAYKEAEKLNGQLSQKASLVNKLEQTTGMNAQQIAEVLAQQEQQRVFEQKQNDPLGYLAQRQEQLEAQIALQNEEKELDKFLSSEEGKDYAPYRDKIQEAAFHLPSMKDKPYNEIAKELFGQSRAQGQQDAYKKIDTKIMTQATSVSKGSPKGKITLEELRKMTAAEQAAILPHSDRL